MKRFVILALFIIILGAAQPAYALKVRCTDPQPEFQTKQTSTIKSFNNRQMAEALAEQQNQPQARGRLQVAERVQNRGQDYAPQPLREGSNFRVCRN